MGQAICRGRPWRRGCGCLKPHPEDENDSDKNETYDRLLVHIYLRKRPAGPDSGGVIPAGVEWVAAADPFNPAPDASPSAVLHDRIDHVL